MKYERLTETKNINEYCSTVECGEHCEDCYVGKLYKRLALLEDKIENGTLIELPCMHKTVFGYYRVTFFSKMFDCIDSELFFNKAEAEKKLKELQNA